MDGVDLDGDGIFDQASIIYAVSGASGSATLVDVTDTYANYKCWPFAAPHSGDPDGCGPAIGGITRNVSWTAPDVVNIDATYAYRFEDGLIGSWRGAIGLGASTSDFDLPSSFPFGTGSCSTQISGDVDGTIQYHCTHVHLDAPYTTMAVTAGFSVPPPQDFQGTSNLISCPLPIND